MYVKYLDQNNYIKYFKLDSGINTSNEFLSHICGFIKALLQELWVDLKENILKYEIF